MSGFPSPLFITSGKDGCGYRVSIGYETFEDMDRAHWLLATKSHSEVLEALKAFMPYAQAEYVPNSLFDQAASAISKAEDAGK